MTLAIGAKRIWDMRVQGVKPGEVVFLSLIGPLNSGNFNVFLPQGQPVDTLDWRWVMDLCVCVVYHSSTDRALLGRVVKAIARNAPNGGYATPFNPHFGYLWLWNAEKQTGTMATWWRGHKGIPLIGIPAEPEQFDFKQMSRLESSSFKGVAAA
jgi:hypothetical protein